MRKLSGLLMVAVLLTALLPSVALAAKPAISVIWSACLYQPPIGATEYRFTVAWDNVRADAIKIRTGDTSAVDEQTLVLDYAVAKKDTSPLVMPDIADANFSGQTYASVMVYDRKGNGTGYSQNITAFLACGAPV